MSEQITLQGEVSLVLSEEERAQLLHLLEQTLGDTRVEVHHTMSPSYREFVLRQETLLRGLILKLRQLSP